MFVLSDISKDLSFLSCVLGLGPICIEKVVVFVWAIVTCLEKVWEAICAMSYINENCSRFTILSKITLFLSAIMFDLNQTFFFSKIIAYKLTCPVRNEGCPIRLFTSTTVYQDCSKGFIFSCLTSHLFIIFIVNKHENGCLDLKTDQQFHFRFVLSAWGLKTALRMGQWKMSGSRLLRHHLPCFVKQARLLAIFSFR